MYIENRMKKCTCENTVDKDINGAQNILIRYMSNITYKVVKSLRSKFANDNFTYDFISIYYKFNIYSFNFYTYKILKELKII